MDKKRFFKVFFIALIFFTIVYFYIGFKLSGFEQIRKDKNIFYDDELVESDEDDGRLKFDNNEFMFLLVGVDHNNLGDTLILSKINFDENTVDLVSIPRDTRVLVNNKYRKINSAHSLGGIDLLTETIEDLLNINIDYYARVNFEAVEALVDTIGGVELYVKQDMYYVDTTEGEELFIDLKEGNQVLDGDKAMQFLRFRSYKMGDIDRIGAQQQFLEAFIDQSLKVKNLAKWEDFLNIYYEYVDTNIPITFIGKGLELGLDWGSQEVNTYTFLGDYEKIDGSDYFLIDLQEADKIVKEIFPNYTRSLTSKTKITEDLDKKP